MCLQFSLIIGSNKIAFNAELQKRKLGWCYWLDLGTLVAKAEAQVTFLFWEKLVNISICLYRVSTFLLRNTTRDLQESYELERNVGISSRGAHFRKSKGFNSKVSNKSPLLATYPAIVIFH